MRVNLLLNNPGGFRQGYLNLDPAALPDNPDGIAVCDLRNLDAFVDANEVVEFVAIDVLDLFRTTQVDAVLNHWLSKLAHGGTISLSVVDFNEVSRYFRNGLLSLDEANILLHGKQTGNFDSRSCSLTLGQLVNVLEAKGLKVLKKRIENYRAVVVAQRP